MNRRILMYVLVGHHNLPDEAMYLAVRKLFPEYELIPRGDYAILPDSPNPTCPIIGVHSK